MSRKSDSETLEALKARKAELDEKIRKKESAIREKLRAEEARKRQAEKRQLDHVKYILGGFYLNNVIKDICNELEKEKSNNIDDSFIVRFFADNFDFAVISKREEDKNLLQVVFLKLIKNKMGESVSPSHDT